MSKIREKKRAKAFSIFEPKLISKQSEETQ
jgi:hypothetical protein